ncbi:MAG TPA: AMP-binding protein [Solirubrobacterales bacterium]|nr:AMP-binding protein [Solirubrobacterales bacterium]
MTDADIHMAQTVGDFWDERVATTPDAPFLLFEGVTETFASFDAVVNEAANGFLAAGVEPGDHVGLVLPSGRDLLRFELGLLKLGAVMVPMIDTLTPAEISYVVEHSEASLVVDDPAQVPPCSSEPPPRPELGPLDPMAIMYTSGSTGKPKGVVQPHAGFPTAGRAIAARLGVGAGENYLCTIPLFHTAGFHQLVGPAIAAGARLTLVPKFSRSEFWDQVRANGATVGIVMPAQMAILMSSPPDHRDRDHTLRVLASHFRPEDFCRRFGVDVVTIWAMTEISGLGTISKPGADLHPDKFVGTPMPAESEVRIVNPDGTEAAPMELGELWYRHPHGMLEYYRNPEATAASLEDGWVKTGDLCAGDGEGGVYFHGRIKNVIKRAGENISGEEVEGTMIEHPEVAECVVVGVSDPIYTEEVHATVSRQPGSTLGAAELDAYCREQLAAWKAPRYIEVIEGELPKLANGKPDRVSIRAAASPESAWDHSAETASGRAR